MKKRKNIIYIIIIIVVAMFVLAKLFLFDRYQGHDTVFHVANIIKLSDTISFSNIFGSDLISYDFNRLGYGVWLFYPKLPHLICAYIYLIIKDVYLSMKIVYLITTILSGIFTYYLAKKIFNNKSIALLSSIIYITVPYHICEIYIRDAFAENFIFFVLPMIFLGLYNLKENNYSKFYILFILGYIIGMNSHLVSMAFYTIFVGIFILYYREFFLKTDKIKALLISTLIVTGITLPFLVTILEHKSVGIYRVFTDYFTDLATVKTFSLKFNNLYIQESINDDVMTYFNISTIILFLCTTISFVFNKKDKYKKDRKILLVFIIIVINIICSQVIWEYVPKLFLSIQFPWRLLIFLALMISLYSPMILLSDRITNNKKNIISFIFIVMILFEGMNNISFYMDKEVSVEDALKSKLALGHQNEYFPHLEVEGIDQMFYSKRRYPVKKYEFITDKNISIDIINDDFPNMEIVVENVNDDTVVEFPRIHYLGYELVSDDGDKIELCNSKNGLLKATINENGTYKLSYVKTILHRLAEFIRLLTVLLMMGFLAVKFVKWKKRKL